MIGEAGYAFAQRLKQPATGAIVAAVLAFAPMADVLAGPIPVGWTSIGAAGTEAPNGVVTAPPVGGPGYSYVTTTGGTTNGGTLGSGFGSETNGSTLTTSAFVAAANDSLQFFFNYVTSDGSGFADYSWARLLNGAMEQVAILFTARTQPAPGNIVPGFGLPAAEAALTPPSVGIQTGTDWNVLGGSSGSCFASGCGYSGWIQSDYTITAAGTYRLQFGVTNWADALFDSGMAIAGTTIAGVPIDPPIDPPTSVPEPASLALFGLGMAALGITRRRRPGSAQA